MAKQSMSLSELLYKQGLERDPDFLKTALLKAAQELMEMDVSAQIKAGLHERTEDRVTFRNGYRSRDWDTRVGTVELQIPKLRNGSYFPALLEPRRRAEEAMYAVIQEAYVSGLSTRKLDSLVRAMGMAEGIDKSRVARMCTELDELVREFRERPLEGSWPYIWLDGTYIKVRENGRVISMAMVVAVAVSDQGERRVIGIDLGPAEDEQFWLGFLRSLNERGLKGVQLVISDAHGGLRKAIPVAFPGATWQRCRVHFMRNVLCLVPKQHQSIVSAAVKTIFAQPDHGSAIDQLTRVAESLTAQFPRVATLLIDAAEDVLAYINFPQEHWRQLHSTNPLERLNKEIKRRSDVVGIFPNGKSAIRLVGALLAEQNDEWETARRYFSLESMAKLKKTEATEPAVPTAATPALAGIK